MPHRALPRQDLRVQIGELDVVRRRHTVIARIIAQRLGHERDVGRRIYPVRQHRPPREHQRHQDQHDRRNARHALDTAIPGQEDCRGGDQVEGEGHIL